MLEPYFLQKLCFLTTCSGISDHNNRSQIYRLFLKTDKARMKHFMYLPVTYEQGVKK